MLPMSPAAHGRAPINYKLYLKLLTLNAKPSTETARIYSMRLIPGNWHSGIALAIFFVVDYERESATNFLLGHF